MANTLPCGSLKSSYAEVVDHLSQASVPVVELSGSGNVAVTLAAGRITAMAFSPQSVNLLWSNPKLSDTELVKNTPDKLVGGIGGDRLWFGPELAYHWDGTPDWESFANYKVPQAADPGAYEFIDQRRDRVTLHAKGELPVHAAIHRVGFEVMRRICLVESPLPKTDPLMKDVEYVGIETFHRLRMAEAIRAGRIDLWHLLQVPAGSVLVVPVKRGLRAEPLSYGLPGDWEEKADHILWRYGGEAKAKFGMSAAALTARAAVLRPLGSQSWALIVRQFPLDASARYADHPYGMPRDDQAFQAWDGFGFGEMEFHSPMLDAQSGPRELEESDQLWAFGGSAVAIGALALRLLGVDVAYVFEL